MRWEGSRQSIRIRCTRSAVWEYRKRWEGVYVFPISLGCVGRNGGGRVVVLCGKCGKGVLGDDKHKKKDFFHDNLGFKGLVFFSIVFWQTIHNRVLFFMYE